MPRVTWSRRSLQDVVALRGSFQTLKKAKAMAARLFAVAEHLEVHPALGRVGVVPGTRELVAAGSHYVVVYALSYDEQEVVVLSVIDGRRDWK